MNLVTVMLFFVYIYGLGYSLTWFLKNSNFFERTFIRMGVGLGTIPFFLVLLDFLHIPIDWKFVLLVSLLFPSFAFFRIILKKDIRLPRIKLTKGNLYFLIVFLIFLLTLSMYVKGAFRYPYFEDDDPWAHSAGIKYVSIEKNFDDPTNSFKYIKPYPPGYDGLMGVLHQTSPEIMWTMKFFNALIISLSIIFFYFFVKNFTKSKDKALFATIILAMVPCYLSHFIWAHSLVITLFIVALYCLVMIPHEKNWVYPTSIVIASICLTQPTQPIKFFFMFIGYATIMSIYHKKIFLKEFLSIIGGYLLSLIWWAMNWKDMFIMGAGGDKNIISEGGSFFTRFIGVIQKAFPPNSGTATRPYTVSDFFIAKSTNMINNPVGVGIIICLLAFISIILVLLTYKSMKKEKKIQIAITLFWLIFTFVGINSMTFHLPIGLYAFRFWMLFAIPLSIISAEGFWFLVGFLKQFSVPKVITVLLLVTLMFFTSGKQKYDVNTAIWGPGQFWTSMDEVIGWVWLKNLPVNTRIFAYSGDEQVIGLNMFSCGWCKDVIEFRKDLLSRNTSDLYNWLKKKRYEYLVIGGMAYKTFSESYGGNETTKLLDMRLREISSFEKFKLVHQTKGVLIFKVL